MKKRTTSMMTAPRESTPLVLVVNGPNLNLLGTREPGIYGSETLIDVETVMAALAAELGLRVEFSQSNHEGEIVDTVHSAAGRASGIIINPGAYTHTSIAIRDAISAVDVPAVKVHISNIAARESFRQVSYVSAVATATIAGAGIQGYLLALRLLAERAAA